ncbi:hypothetical protein FDP41_012871 [Naegleria fowleri]|uniref:Essential protein Yae1 N-terminal domain-containing protein n=1 Tax=Naegleria fowleri TaxID=5763 RepID=A0A6A5BSN8_NAEFO|nr:uncharacterized protein FDP41_012871 [Naegleria fowleri]KAF0981083.1 hypothetical protein FDP41_012871 [Naegleria fowleri]CAG4711709.1 unnamed protein product [Naegleria fowleri]
MSEPNMAHHHHHHHHHHEEASLVSELVSSSTPQPFVDDIDDVFDKIIHLEQNFYENGKELGMQHAALVGKEEGFNFGVAYGRKVGKEIGEVIGLCIFLKNYLKNDHEERVISATKEKIISTILQIENMVKDFPWDNPATNSLNLEEFVETLRNKKKLLEIRSKQILGKVNNVQKQDYSF